MAPSFIKSKACKKYFQIMQLFTQRISMLILKKNCIHYYVWFSQIRSHVGIIKDKGFLPQNITLKTSLMSWHLGIIACLDVTKKTLIIFSIICWLTYKLMPLDKRISIMAVATGLIFFPVQRCFIERRAFFLPTTAVPLHHGSTKA